MVRPFQVNPVNSLLSAVVSVVVVGPAAAVLLLTKFLARVAVRLRFGPGADLLPGCDCVTNALPLRTPDGLLNMTIRVRGKLSMERVRQRFREKLVDLKTSEGSWLHPKLRSTFKWFLGFRITILNADDEFDVDDHFAYVRRGDDGGDGDVVVCESDEDYEDVQERINNGEVHPGRPQLPPWKFHIFYLRREEEQRDKPAETNDDAAAASAAKTEGTARTDADVEDSLVDTYVTLHLDHAIVDGGALSLAMMPALLDFDAETDPALMFKNLKPVTNLQRVFMDVKAFFLVPMVFLRMLVTGNKGCDFNPLHLRSDSGSRDRGRFILAPRPLPLQTYKEIQKKTKAKVNSIVAFCVYRALYRFSKELEGSSSTSLGPSSEQNGRSKKIEDRKSRGRRWTWTIASPVSLWVPGDKIELTNKTAALLYTCTGDEIQGDTKAARLAALARVAHTIEDPSKFDYAWCTTRFLSVFFNSVPRILVDATGIFSNMEKMTAVFSNIRGADGQQRMLGCDVTHMTAYVSMWKNLDLGIVGNSYGGAMSMSIAGRKGSFRSRDELRKILHFYEDEVLTLHEIATKKDK